MFTINYASAEFLPANVVAEPLPLPAARPASPAGACAAIRAIARRRLIEGTWSRSGLQRELEAQGFNPATIRTQLQRAYAAIIQENLKD